MSGSSRGVLPDVRDCLVGYPGFSGVVVRPTRMSGSGWESHLDVRELLVGPPGCQLVVGRPSLISGSGRGDLPDVWSGREDLRYVREWSGCPTGCP